jgi:sterol desaturase/sphingolipid hydroxylase (fatty acid hydroxylase superfamily)
MYKAEIRTKEEQPKLFSNIVIEKLTYTSPAIIILMYAIVSFILIRHFIHLSPQATLGFIISWYGVGLASWTLGEYILHRFLYHDHKDASYHKGHNYLFHGIHHTYPADTKRIILPAIPSLGIASVLFGFFYGLFWLITGSGSLAFVFAPGFINGYVAYMLVHFTVHKVPSPKRFNFWWRHHNIHHYQHHDRAFGVTTPLWDIVFRTMPEKGRRTIIQK